MKQKLVKLKRKCLIMIINIRITKQEFSKLTADNFKERVKPADLVSKFDVDNKLISFNRKITSNKTKYLEVKKN